VWAAIGSDIQQASHFFADFPGGVLPQLRSQSLGGGMLNAPLINYYEHGTFLTLNHAHTALFGAFGLLAIGLVYFCLRYIAGDRVPFISEKVGIWAFWLYNAGLVLWILLNFFPIGWAQLAAVLSTALPMRAVSPSITRPWSGSGCGCPATCCLQSARCSWRGTSSPSSDRSIRPWREASGFQRG
jgi:hypothetical protein